MTNTRESLAIIHRCWIQAEGRDAKWILARAFDYVYWRGAGYELVQSGPFTHWVSQ